MQAGFCCSVVSVTQVAPTFRIDLRSSEKPLSMPVFVTDRRTGNVVRRIRTDAQGDGEIHDLKPGAYDISSPVWSDVVDVISEGGTDVLSIKAQFNHAPIEVAQLTVTTTDTLDGVIPGARVVLEAVDTWPSHVGEGRTDGSGSISLKVADGDYILRVSVPHFQTALVPVRVTKTGWSGFTLALPLGHCAPLLSPVPVSIKPKE